MRDRVSQPGVGSDTALRCAFAAAVVEVRGMKWLLIIGALALAPGVLAKTKCDPALRPDHSAWKPVANALDPDNVQAWKNAAKHLGMDIIVSYPVPAMAGAAVVCSYGGVGIYINRKHAGGEDVLRNEMFNQKKAMSQ